METYRDELYHYGVKGMKWGVRQDRRAARSQAKIDRLNAKIAKGNDSRFAGRVINDRRRGRVARISAKRDNRQAKADYIRAKKSGDTSKQDAALDRLNKTRIKRAQNAAQTAAGVSNFRRGRYNANRQKGMGVVRSALTSGAIANTVVNSPTSIKYQNSGKRIVESNLKKIDVEKIKKNI